MAGKNTVRWQQRIQNTVRWQQRILAHPEKPALTVAMQNATRQKRLTQDVRASVVSPYNNGAHPIFHVVDLLGLHRSTVASILGVTPATFSAWVVGTEQLTRAQFRRLLTICREAHTEAQRIVAEAYKESDRSIDRLASISIYSIRVKEANKLLTVQEQFRGYQG